MAIYEILFNVDSIQALQCEIFSYVYELNLYSVYSWQIIILLELSRHPIELSIKLIVLSILFYSILFYSILMYDHYSSLILFQKEAEQRSTRTIRFRVTKTPLWDSFS